MYYYHYIYISIDLDRRSAYKSSRTNKTIVRDYKNGSSCRRNRKYREHREAPLHPDFSFFVSSNQEQHSVFGTLSKRAVLGAVPSSSLSVEWSSIGNIALPTSGSVCVFFFFRYLLKRDDDDDVIVEARSLSVEKTRFNRVRAALFDRAIFDLPISHNDITKSLKEYTCQRLQLSLSCWQNRSTRELLCGWKFSFLQEVEKKKREREERQLHDCHEEVLREMEGEELQWSRDIRQGIDGSLECRWILGVAERATIEDERVPCVKKWHRSTAWLSYCLESDTCYTRSRLPVTGT